MIAKRFKNFRKRFEHLGRLNIGRTVKIRVQSRTTAPGGDETLRFRLIFFFFVYVPKIHTWYKRTHTHTQTYTCPKSRKVSGSEWKL